MAKLPAPLREHLVEHVDERTVQRVWSGVRARRGGSRFALRRLPAWSYGVLATAAVLLLAVLGLRWQEGGPPAPLAVSSGPLVSRAGAALSVLGGERASSNDLADGSSIALTPGSRLEVLENTSKTFVSVLRSGRGSFAVRPGGPRRWTVEAGLATVEVVGTRFSVTRLPDGVAVDVEHGIVLVRSELIQDHVQRLTAGQRLVIHAPASPFASASASAPAGSAPVTTPTLAPVVAIESARVLPVTLEQLLGQANEQRRRGDVAGAETSLRRALSEHPNEPQAALTAFTLGKLLLDAEGRPRDAAAEFAHCLALSPPSALAEDALFRLGQAQAQAGESEAAQGSARAYIARYPQGRHVADVSRWLDAR